VVLRSVLSEVVREIEALGKASGLKLVQFGHIGDGNLHPNILFDPRSESEAGVHHLAQQIASVAIRHGGVLSGEYGIGSLKLPYMAQAVDAITLEALWSVKRALDPGGILNPGKVLPGPGEAAHD
jgi:glycolate oxidase